MKHCRILLITVGLFIASAAASAQAQIYGPGPGGLTSHLFSVPGVVNNGAVTVFECTNATDKTVAIGVEVFGPGGGPALNNALATQQTLSPGATVMYATEAMVGLGIDVNLGLGIIHKGSARILADARSGVLCSAFLTDPNNAPVTFMSDLSVVAKKKQKGD
jgi:hypothetical protein